MGILEMGKDPFSIVLPFLSIKDIVMCKAVSLEFKELCETFPIVSLDINSVDLGEGSYENIEKKFKDLDEKIDILSLNWHFTSNNLQTEKTMIDRLLIESSSFNLRVLIMDVLPDNNFTYVVPQKVFLNQSIEYINLSGIETPLLTHVVHNDEGEEKIECLQPDKGFRNLKFLKFSNCRILGAFGLWISEACPSLKELILEHLHGDYHFPMKSSSLERLVLDILLDGGHVVDYRIKAPNLVTLDVNLVDTRKKPFLDLQVPRLQNFILRGTVLENCYLGSLYFLSEVSMYMGRHSFKRGRRTRQDLKLLFRSIRHAERLTLNGLLAQYLAVRKLRGPIFSNLHSFHLLISIKCKFFNSCSILQTMPNLKILVLECYKSTDSYRFPVKNKSSKSEVLRVINGLEMVEVQLYKDINDIDVLDYILKNAAGLSGMVVHYQPSEYDLQTLAYQIKEMVDLHDKTPFSAIKFKEISALLVSL